MGYYVSYNIDVSFKKEDADKVLAAINALHEPELMKKQASGGRWSEGEKKEIWYSWVENPPAGGWIDLNDAFGQWGFDLSDEIGGIYTFYWSGEKLGDEECFFEAISPWLTGSIYARGEDDDEWGFSFHDGKMSSLKCIREWVEV